MSFAFEILSAALNEAVFDVNKEKLPRRVVEREIKPLRPKIFRCFKQTRAFKARKFIAK